MSQHLFRSWRPFFYVHAADGNVFSYRDLLQFLDRDKPLYGLQAPESHDELTRYASIEQLAAYHTQMLPTIEPQGPYLLVGWSFAGVVAFEMSQQLQKQGYTVALLALLDSFVSGTNQHSVDDTQLLIELAQAYGISLLPYALRELDPEEQLRSLLQHSQAAHLLLRELDFSQLHTYFHVYKTNLQSVWNYELQCYTGPITLLQAKEKISANLPDPVPDWSKLAHDHRYSRQSANNA